MQLPFSRDAFFEVFADYNAAIWPWPIVAAVLGAAILVLLLRRPAWAGRAIFVVLSAYWGVMAVAYHMVFFARINPAAIVFGVLFLLQATVFLVEGARRDRVRLLRPGGLRGVLAAALILYAFGVYPLIGLLWNHPYPETPLFGVAPCPTTIFTIGILLLVDHPKPSLLSVVPLAWAAIGTGAALLLDVPQDWGLPAALLAWIAVSAMPSKAAAAARSEHPR